MTGHEALVAATYILQALGYGLLVAGAAMAVRLAAATCCTRGDCPRCGAPITHYNATAVWCVVCGWKDKA